MGKILFNFFVLNKKNFIVILMIFLIGFVCGILVINHSDQYQKEEISEEINSLIDTIKNSSEINKFDLLMLSFKRNCSMILVVWLLGCTIIGGIFIYFAIIYEGFLLGYTISALIAVLGIKDGLIFALISLLMQNIVLIPALFLISENGIKLYKGIYKKCINIKEEVIRHTIIMLISIMLSIVSSFFEVYISVNLLMFFKEIL